MKISKYFQFAALAMMIGLLGSCSDDDMSVRTPDYNPSYKGVVDANEADYTLDYNAQNIEISFTSDMAWTAGVFNSEGEACDWASLSPESGELPSGVDQVAGVAKEAVSYTITVSVEANDDYDNDRICTVKISTPKDGSKTITIGQSHRFDIMDVADIPNYEKFYYPGRQDAYFTSEEDLFRTDSKYSWWYSKQSEHFFLFWDKRFGKDPNADDVPGWAKVDTDDLLEKAEQFFHTNVEVLGMCTLGEGKSLLDKYKMQIWLIYDDGWTATGSGWGEIGSLWVTPSTCKPVGSTIAHEIGHSFQFQVGADRAYTTGEDVAGFGFRYGFGPNGAGGCAYWEQCAQWQAHQDYPEEQFSYHTSVWQANYHRHFHHEWMRYASYYLQTYWTNKQGIDAYGRIWQESAYPEDAIEAYTRLYLDGDIEKFYDELYDYASHMVYYDLDGVREYYPDQEKGNYKTQLFQIEEDKYQVGYASTPGTTGFNVIELDYMPGTTVSVTINSLDHGSDLCNGDPGIILNGDGAKVGKATKYNQTGGEANFRLGYVAIVNNKPVYSEMTKGAKATATYDVPSDATELYLVIAATPKEYNRHEWNDDETDDEQWPYILEMQATGATNWEEDIDLSGIDLEGQPKDVELNIDVHATEESATYDFAHFNLAYRDKAALCYAFCMLPEDMDAKLIHPMDLVNTETGEFIQDAENTIVMRLKQPDGTYVYDDNCGGEFGGFWCDNDGYFKGWGEGTYTKLHNIQDMEIGYMPGKAVAGECYKETIELVYTLGGKQYIATFHFNYYVD